MEITTLKIPDNTIGEPKVCDAGLFQFKADLARVYDFIPNWETYLKVKEGDDDFILYYESGVDNPVLIIKRFKKGKDVDITLTDYNKTNQKLKEVIALKEKQKAATKQFQLRKSMADLILKNFTTNNLKFEVLKTGIEITLLDTTGKHHVSCVLSNNGIISEPLIRIAYQHGKKIKISDLNQLVKLANNQLDSIISTTQQVKLMLPPEWFVGL